MGIKQLIPSGLEAAFIENCEWQKQNGISVLAAANHITSPFLLTMSDHLFDQSILDLLLHKPALDELNLQTGTNHAARSTIDSKLLRRCGRERFVQSRFAAISGISMNDAAFRSLVDCRNDDAYSIQVGHFRGTHLLLHRAQTCHNAAIAERSLQCLACALGG